MGVGRSEFFASPRCSPQNRTVCLPRGKPNRPISCSLGARSSARITPLEEGPALDGRCGFVAHLPQHLGGSHVDRRYRLLAASNLHLLAYAVELQLAVEMVGVACFLARSPRRFHPFVKPGMMQRFDLNASRTKHGETSSRRNGDTVQPRIRRRS